MLINRGRARRAAQRFVDLALNEQDFRTGACNRHRSAAKNDLLGTRRAGARSSFRAVGARAWPMAIRFRCAFISTERHEHRAAAGRQPAEDAGRFSAERAPGDDRRIARKKSSRWRRNCRCKCGSNSSPRWSRGRSRRKMLYNPRTRFIDYVVPGVIGLILQLHHRDADGLHDRARTRIRHALSIDGHVTAAARNRDRENPAVPRHFDLAHSRHHCCSPAGIFT